MRKREHDVTADEIPSDERERDPQFITALARGLEVLRTFRRDDGALGNLEIAKRTKLPKPTVSRITYTLSKLGYLQYVPDTARYRLSVGVLALGYTSLGSFGIRELARPMMQELADDTNITVALGTLDRHAMVYLEVCRGDSLFPLALELGSHIKLATSAMGRAYILGRAPAQRLELMDRIAAREGTKWRALKKGLEQAQEEFEKYGFVTSVGDWKTGVNAVGVPLKVGENGTDFALNCGGPTFLATPERLIEEIGPKLVALARRIEAKLSGL